MIEISLEQLECNMNYALRVQLILIRKLYDEKGYTDNQFDKLYEEVINEVYKNGPRSAQEAAK